MPSISKLPNQNGSERTDVLFRIAKCRRLAHQVGDPETTERLLALAAKYEQKLPPLPQELRLFAFERQCANHGPVVWKPPHSG